MEMEMEGFDKIKSLLLTFPCCRICPRCSAPCSSPYHPSTYECPPCSNSIVVKLICGHQVDRKCCEPPIDESIYICMQPCSRRLGLCDHNCPKLCYEECSLCEVMIERPHPNCGHWIKVPCYCPTFEEGCQVLIYADPKSKCGHKVKIPCHLFEKMSLQEVTTYCQKSCGKRNILNDKDCGHECKGRCGSCYQGRFHIRCAYPCEKIQICGHVCKTPCPVFCPPCNDKCMRECEHYTCPYECGVPCNFECQKPCPYICPHLSCGNKCGQVCSRSGCEHPCDKILSCGHSCCGFCGEICPPCKVCRVDEIFIIHPFEFDQNTRFIYIPSCAHTIDSETLSLWINVDFDEGEIMLRRCPVPTCMKPLPLTLRRFSSQIRLSWDQVTQVKRKIVGNEAEMGTRLAKLNFLIKSQPSIRFKGFVHLLLSESRTPFRIPNSKALDFASMHMYKVKFLEWLVTLWIDAEKGMCLKEGIFTPEHYVKYETQFAKIFEYIMERTWPLHPNEVNSLLVEIKRVSDLGKLYNRMSSQVEEQIRLLGNSTMGQIKFQEAQEILFKWAEYSPKLQNDFEQKFNEFLEVQRYTLGISDQERIQIVEAFGSRAGRWFKCTNGHVYVVTECGGATELGTCPECGEVIGGVDHMLVEHNQLAGEMDGAEEPLYPTVLNRQ